MATQFTKLGSEADNAELEIEQKPHLILLNCATTNRELILQKLLLTGHKTKEEVKKLNDRINERSEEWQKPVSQQTEL